jgi:hypothetical protein
VGVPSGTAIPAGLCPPPLTETLRLCLRAKASPCVTSVVVIGCTTIAGCLWNLFAVQENTSEERGLVLEGMTGSKSCYSREKTEKQRRGRGKTGYIACGFAHLLLKTRIPSRNPSSPGHRTRPAIFARIFFSATGATVEEEKRRGA